MCPMQEDDPSRWQHLVSAERRQTFMIENGVDHRWCHLFQPRRLPDRVMRLVDQHRTDALAEIRPFGHPDGKPVIQPQRGGDILDPVRHVEKAFEDMHAGRAFRRQRGVNIIGEGIRLQPRKVAGTIAHGGKIITGKDMA